MFITNDVDKSDVTSRSPIAYCSNIEDVVFIPFSASSTLMLPPLGASPGTSTSSAAATGEVGSSPSDCNEHKGQHMSLESS